MESRYLYDPLGRRTGKRVWRRMRDLTGWMSLSRKPEVTWYGWDGDRLTTVQTDTTRIQTVYQPGSFTPLIRIETENGEWEKAQRRSLAEKLQSEGSEDGHGVVFPAELVRMLDRLEEEIRADRVSSESRQWLAQCGLTVEQLATQVEPEYTAARSLHLYHCDHRGLPLALISEDGNTVWSAEYDEWGNQLNEENPHHLYQPYRLPGQQHDEESGLYYNRNRYYDPLLARYITQDPIGLNGGINLYTYPLNPLSGIDPLGLCLEDLCIIEGAIGLSILWGMGSSYYATQAQQSGNQTSTTTTSLPACNTAGQCSPCNPPVGEKFNKTTHYDHDHAECLQRTGSKVHWHYQTHNQIPYPDCTCKLQKHAFGGCGVAPP